MLVNERFFPIGGLRWAPAEGAIAAVPPLDGYVATTPKEQAEVVLLSAQGDPVLAAWQYGLGRAVAWTPDAGRPLERRVGGNSASSSLLWGNVLSWLLPYREDGQLSVRVESEAEGSYAVLAENRGGWEEVRPTRATLLGPEGKRQEVALEPAGPGRYRARLRGQNPGAYVVQVSQECRTRRRAARRVRLGGAVSSRVQGDRGGPGAAIPGGRRRRRRVLEDASQAVAESAGSAVARWPAWPALLVLAALFWPLEIASRRLSVPEAGVWLSVARSRAVTTVRRAPSTQHSAPSTQESPAAQTTQRLLERKRAFREKDRSR